MWDPSGQATSTSPSGVASRATLAPPPSATGAPGATGFAAPSMRTTGWESFVGPGVTVTRRPLTRIASCVFTETAGRFSYCSWRAWISRSPLRERTRTNSPAAWKS